MTYRPDFSGCWAKIERAWEHRHALDAEIDPVQRGERDQGYLVSKLDSESGYYVSSVAALPDRFLTRVGLLIGDTVHNLRCVLDHLVWQLASVKTGGIDLPGVSDGEARNVRFPIDDTPPSSAAPDDFVKVVP